MFDTIKRIIGGIVGMFSKNTIESAMNVTTVLSSEAQNNIEMWLNEYANTPSWRNDRTVFSMNQAAAIASEFAKLVTMEFESEISNNDFLNEQYQVVIDDIRNTVELACAGGAVVFKPYISNGKIAVDIVQANAIYPVAFNNRGEMTACILPEIITKGKITYTRLESHTLNADHTYTIINTAFKKNNNGAFSSLSNNQLGEQIYLSEVEEWASLVPQVTLKNVEKPLFSYFKMPIANNKETNSPLGVSIYARVAEENGGLHQVDKQYSRILWEFEGSELAVHADLDMFKKDNQGNSLMPEGKERLYRKLDIDTTSTTTKQIDTFSPEIRDTPLFNGLNKLLRQVEWQVGLAYGTISDPQDTDKTATEVKASKQRSYQTVKDIQKKLKTSLENLAYAMWYLGTIAQLPVNPGAFQDKKDMSFDYDDSILIDRQSELQSMQTDVSLGILDKVYYVMEKYKVDEATAKKMIPKETIVGGDPFASNAE